MIEIYDLCQTLSPLPKTRPRDSIETSSDGGTTVTTGPAKPFTTPSTFDVGNIPVEALLFQAGYLTIASARFLPGRLELNLRYPNKEVQSSLNDALLRELSRDPMVPAVNVSRLYDILTCLVLISGFFRSSPFTGEVRRGMGAQALLFSHPHPSPPPEGEGDSGRRRLVVIR